MKGIMRKGDDHGPGGTLRSFLFERAHLTDTGKMIRLDHFRDATQVVLPGSPKGRRGKARARRGIDRRVGGLPRHLALIRMNSDRKGGRARC